MTPVSYYILATFLHEDRARQSLWAKFPGGNRLNASGAESPTSHDEAERIAARFVRARLHATALPAFPGPVPIDLAAAYACQDAGIQHWPDRVAGWKVARIPGEWQTAFPAERLIGPAFQGNIRVARQGQVVDCPVFAGGFAAVESELVLRLGHDAPPDRVDWAHGEALDLVADLHIGVEIASSPLATLNDLGSGAVISDFGNNWGVVLGPPIADWRRVREVAVETYIDDVAVGRGTANLQAGAFGALLFTLAECARRGRSLRAGDVISTGMITGVHDIRVGQSSRHVFDGHGEVHCRATRATPHASAGATPA